MKKNSVFPFLSNVISVFISYMAATYIRFQDGGWGDKNLHFAVMIVMLLVCALQAAFFSDADFQGRKIRKELVFVIRDEVVLVSGTLVITFFLGWSKIISRLVFLHFIWMYAALDIVLRFIFKKFSNRESKRIKLLVVTPHRDIDSLCRRLHKTLPPAYEIIGFASIDELLTDKRKPGEITGRLVQTAFDEVFIYAPDAPQERTLKLISGFTKMGVPCYYCLGDGRVHTQEFADVSCAVYGKKEIPSGQLAIKRAMDIAGGIVGCLITLILTVFIAPAIKLESKGPVFFSQVRIGRNGRRFKIYKFRSMYVDAEERKKELMAQNEVNGLMFKMEKDPRITKVGAFLRKTSLDEFPQFFNVLKGDMSLVGTRPPTEDEFIRYNERYRKRISMTPGLTGLWQVSGRSDIKNFDDVVRLDVQYIDSWSLWLDIKIIFKTVRVLFSGKGAE